MKKRNNILLILLFIEVVLFTSCKSKKKEVSKEIVLHDLNEFICMIDSDEFNIFDENIFFDFDINETFGNENITLLDYAISKNNEEISMFLMSEGIDVNHVDNKGLSSFTKAIGNMSPKLLNSFLKYGLDYKVNAQKNMNYFVYMLYKKDYISALNFIKNELVLDYLKTKSDLFIYLIYYWDSTWSSEIGNYLLQNDFCYDSEKSYFFYAIDEFSLDAIRWLDSKGIQKDLKYYDEKYEYYLTPYEYAENKLLEMTNYFGKDYILSQEDTQIKELKAIIDFLRE